MFHAKTRQALSLLEIQIAMLLLLLVSLFLMSLFATGQKHTRRAIDYSRATVLAQMRLEEARATPLRDLTPGSRTESEPYLNFETVLRVTPYEAALSQLEIRVTAPSGATARVHTLVKEPSEFSGVVTDAFTNQVAWVEGTNLRAWNENSGSASNLGAVGDGREGGGLAGYPGSNLLWRAGSQHAPVSFFETLPAPGTWSAPLPSPVPAASDATSVTRLSGMAADFFGNELVLADSANRGLWLYRGAAWSNTIARPTRPPLGRPAGIASDPALTLVWVADEDYQCLRKLLCPQAAAAYPAAQLESAGALGSWHRTRFRPPATIGMGSPVGVTMDPMGHAVYVHDRARLYRFIDASNTWEMLGNLPTPLINEGPSGLACDRFGSHLYLNSKQGSLWKVRAISGLTSADFRQLAP